MVRIGIVGCGNTVGIAGMHIQAYQLQKRAQIVALYDIIPARAAEYVDKYKLTNVQVCTSYEELLSLVDAVSICTPNVTHGELIVKALYAGKHVLCEKPFGESAEGCMDAMRHASMSDRVCMIGLCYRGIPAVRYMKKLIEDGTIGRVLFARQCMGGDRFNNEAVKLEWRTQTALSGSGVIGDLGSHMLDITDWLLRPSCGRIAEVQCMSAIKYPERKEINTGRVHLVDNDDVASFTARLEDGTLVAYTASRVAATGHHFEIYGTKGVLVYNGSRAFELGIKNTSGADSSKIYGTETRWESVPEELYMTDSAVPKKAFLINFFHETKEFLDCIENGTASEIDLSRGLYIQKLIDAITRASQTGLVEKVEG